MIDALYQSDERCFFDESAPRDLRKRFKNIGNRFRDWIGLTFYDKVTSEVKTLQEIDRIEIEIMWTECGDEAICNHENTPWMIPDVISNKTSILCGWKNWNRMSFVQERRSVSRTAKFLCAIGLNIGNSPQKHSHLCRNCFWIKLGIVDVLQLRVAGFTDQKPNRFSIELLNEKEESVICPSTFPEWIVAVNRNAAKIREKNTGPYGGLTGIGSRSERSKIFLASVNISAHIAVCLDQLRAIVLNSPKNLQYGHEYVNLSILIDFTV